MADAVYIDFECLKTKPPTPMLLGVLSDVDRRQEVRQFVVSESVKKVPSRSRDVSYTTLEEAIRAVVETAESNNCPIVGWSLFDRDVILRADIPDPLKTAVTRHHVNALAIARPWKTKVYPDVKIARENAHSPKNTLDKFASLAGYRNVAALRAGEPATWLRRMMKGAAAAEWRKVLAYNAHDLAAVRLIWLKASSELASWRADERASYYVDSDVGHPIRFRAGATNARLDALLGREGASTWAFMTAWNPGSIAKARAANDAAQAKLAALLTSMKYTWLTGRGASDDGSWGPEESLLVLGISRRKARRLGRRFGQFAIVTGRAGSAATLVSCAVPRTMP
jgi:hypothetical protein